MNKSASITKLAGALSKAQAEMPVVEMNKENKFLNSKYADLGAVIVASRPVLAKHGLSLSQFPSNDGDQVGVTTILMHESGEFLETSISIPSGDKKGLSAAQVAGATISYLRRYAWASVLGMYADEDTDGHAPTTGKSSNTSGKSEQVRKPEQSAVSDELWAEWLQVTAKAKALQIGTPEIKRDVVKPDNLTKIIKHHKEQIATKEGK